MAKLTNVRERVHQPFYDTLVRTGGLESPQVQPNSSLFNLQSKQGNVKALTNFGGGNTLPSDQSHVILALRAFSWFRAPTQRVGTTTPSINGDFPEDTTFFDAGQPGAGNGIGNYNDVYRLHWQCQEQLHWDFGTGLKNSIENLPHKFFPDGQGLYAQIGGVTDLVHFSNGTPDHTAILKLARAILLPPRQNVACTANIYQLEGGINTAVVQQNGRNMLSLVDNLNAVDGVQKCIAFMFDGLFARDVQ